MRFRVPLTKLRGLILGVALVLLSFWLGWRVGSVGGKPSLQGVKEVLVDRTQPESRAQIDMLLFWQVWDTLEQKYLNDEDIKPQEMVWGAIAGMTKALGDPYTVFLPPKEQEASQEELNGTFEGVGIQLGFKDEVLAVIAPLSGMPAEAAGVKAGDLILHIKDENRGVDTDTLDMSLPKAVDTIRGPKGTAVILTLLHQGKVDPVEIAIVRDTILIASVELDWLEGESVAHLKLMRFGGNTDSEWDEVVAQIAARQNQIRGVVLDLRNNPGGFLDGSVFIGSEFIENGNIVLQENSAGEKTPYKVNRVGKLLKLPLVVLINKGSASASEIVAGAIQDTKRGKLLGTQSFGKGTIQESQDLPGGTGIHITTAKWLTPSGRWIHETGLTPDIVVELTDEDLKDPAKDPQLDKALETLN
ncbi:TPA: peptidase S41 [Candidatus Beckwithbacteria bacterium]|nr:peptidase S41 [Candidatus Beckwithbacteria bacterium]